MKKLFMALSLLASASYGGDTVLSNEVAAMTFGWSGALKSIRELGSGRELVKPEQFLFLSRKEGLLYSSGFEALGGDSYRWRFGTNGTVTARIMSFGKGWTYEVTAFDVPGVRMVYFGWLKPIPAKWRGGALNMFSDEESGVILRSFEPEIGMHDRNHEILYLDISPEYRPYVGARGMIVAGPRRILQDAMKTAAKVGGVFTTSCSGPYALGSEHARGSYLFTETSPGSCDDWIDLAERGGMDTIHQSSCGSRGHYFPTSVLYPNGYEDFARCAEMIRGAGMRVSMHTLTAGINPRDPWITPVCSPDLIVKCSHTLAKDLGPEDTEMCVNEKPENWHHTFHSYGSNGNTFFFDGELIRYTGIRYEPPYAFTGVERGAWKTNRKGVIPAGSRVDYLHQRYDAFYPRPGTRLMEEMGDQIAKLFHAGHLDQIYFDGSEGLASGNASGRYDIDAVRLSFVKKLSRDTLVEGACTQVPDCWWYLSRYGAWDHSLWGAKLFVDQHSRDTERIRKGNLLEPQTGWWAPRQADSRARGHFLDEMEYFAKRNAADDSAMSLQGIDMRRQRMTPFSVSAQVTVLGWYERFRRAGAFTAEALELFAKEGVDSRLRQEADGVWRCRRVDATVHRITSVGDGSERWRVAADAPKSAAIRVEALYAPDAATGGVSIVTAADAFKASGSESPRVETGLRRGEGPHGKTLVLSAANRGDSVKGAWAACEAEWKRPYLDLRGSKAFGFWVKGDGKGEMLCLSLKSPPEFSHRRPFHLVRIDFTGWRYVNVLLRERDSADWEKSSWPFSKVHNMQYLASDMADSPVKTLGFYLSDLEPGTKAEVEIGELTGYPVKKNTTGDAAVSVNGVRHALPFDLESGEYAELDDGVWTRYSEKGSPLVCLAAEKAELKRGENEIVYSGSASEGAARAEVTVFALGPRFPAVGDLAKLPRERRRWLDYEAEMPMRYQPKDGFEGRLPVLVRPGEKAFLELRISGAVANPSLAVTDGSKRVWTFPVKLAENDRLFCRDGRVWYVLRESGLDASKIVARGALEEPLPVLDRPTGFVVSSTEPDGAAATIDVIKRYSEGAKHPNLGRRYTFGQGASGIGDTEGVLNSNWQVK